MEYLNFFLAYVGNLKKASGENWKGTCPFHLDNTPSFSANVVSGLWKCFGCGAEGNARQFSERLGLATQSPQKPIYAARKPLPPLAADNENARITWTRNTPAAVYPYTDAAGKVLIYEVGRFYGKDGKKFFLPRQPDATTSDGWRYSLEGLSRVLYHLPQLGQSQVVYYVEGEKDVHTLATLGVTATTHAGGSNGTVTSAMLSPLRDKTVVLIPDNDEPGRKLVERVSALLKGSARRVKVLRLPGLADKGDVTDWIEAGGTIAELAVLTREAPVIHGEKEHFPVLRTFSQIQEKKIPWLWCPYIPLGRITMLEGDPGQGKSWFSLAVATAVTYGGWPVVDEHEDNLMDPSHVIYVTCEDDPEDTIKRRLRILQTRQEQIHLLSGKTSGDKKETEITFADIDIFDQAIGDLKAKLLIVDPVQAYLPSGVDMAKAEQVRGVMKSLQRLAARHQCAIVLVRHLSKSGKERALYKGMGSIDFTAAARSVLVCAERKDLSRTEGKILSRRFAAAHIKTNMGMLGKTVEFELKLDEFFWVGTSEVSAEELLSPANALASCTAQELDDAKRYLTVELVRGPVPVERLFKKARSVSIRAEAILAARGMLGIEVAKDESDQWVWFTRDKTHVEVNTRH